MIPLHPVQVVRVLRSDPVKGQPPRWVDYEVPHTPGMRVLDAIKWIKDTIDGTLAYRWNCGNALCGSCAMEVDGRPALTCKTELKPSLRPVTIRPMRAFPVIKDLACDYSAAYEREKPLKPWYVPEKESNEFLIIAPEEIAVVRKFRACIECFICNDNCRPVRDGNVPFLGPKSIVKAMCYDLHPRDQLNRAVSMEKDGLWNCNLTRCCQRHCPAEIPITDNGILPAMEATRNKSEFRKPRPGAASLSKQSLPAE